MHFCFYYNTHSNISVNTEYNLLEPSLENKLTIDHISQTMDASHNVLRNCSYWDAAKLAVRASAIPECSFKLSCFTIFVEKDI